MPQRSALPDARTTVRLAAILVGLALAGWGAGELVRTLHGADLSAVRDVAAQRTPLETEIAHVLSRLGSSLLIAPLAVVCCAVLYRMAGPARALYLAVCTAGAAVLFNVDKLLVGRPRPPVAHLEPVTHSSFPSGHATLSAGFYVALLILSISLSRSRPRTAAAATAVGALVLGVAASRVYLGVHYPTDVIAGMILGTAWTTAVALAFRRRWHHPARPRRASPRPARGWRQAARESSP